MPDYSDDALLSAVKRFKNGEETQGDRKIIGQAIDSEQLKIIPAKDSKIIGQSGGVNFGESNEIVVTGSVIDKQSISGFTAKEVLALLKLLGKKEDSNTKLIIAIFVAAAIIIAGLFVLLRLNQEILISNGETSTPPPTSTPWPLVDSFIYTDPQGLCMALAENAPQVGRKNAIKIMLDISSLDSYCGWGIRLNGYDANTKENLTFWVKGEAGGEQFEIGIKDSITHEGNEPKVLKVAPDAWQQFSIPLEEFEGLNLTSLDYLTLNLKHTLGSGIIYVADFSFGDAVP